MPVQGRVLHTLSRSAVSLLAAAVLAAALALSLALPGGARAAESCPSSAHGTGTIANWAGNQGEQLDAGFKVYTESNPNPVLTASGGELTGVLEAKAGFELGLAVMAGRCNVLGWGANYFNGLGSGARASAPHPVPVVTTSGAELEGVKEVSALGASYMALGYNGSVWTWGGAELGQRGNGESGWERTARQTEPEIAKPRFKAAEVESLKAHEVEGKEVRVTQVSQGGRRNFALLSTGEVLGWGEDVGNRLGITIPQKEFEEKPQYQCIGELYERAPGAPCIKTPQPIPGLSEIEKVVAGTEVAYAVKKGGKEVLSWGANKKGGLGIGTAEETAGIQKVKWTPSSPIVEMVAGGQYALARLQNGTVYAWGGDESGELGVAAGNNPAEKCGPHACEQLPVRVTSLTHVVQLSAERYGTSMALKEEANGKKVPYVFGNNGFWELFGLGEINYTQESTSATPLPIKGLASASSVSISANKGVAVLEGPAPGPRMWVVPGEGSLTAKWTEPDPLGEKHPYNIRIRPLVTKSYSKMFHIEPCEPKPEPACTNEKKFTEFKEPGSKTVEKGPLRVEPYVIAMGVEENRVGPNGGQKRRTVSIIGTPLAPQGSPSNVSAPAITAEVESGEYKPAENVEVGKPAKINPGTWNPSSGVTYSYTWLRCEGLGESGSEEELVEEEPAECTAVGTGETFTPAKAEIGQTLIVKVEAKANGQAAVAVAPAVLILPEGVSEPPPPPANETLPGIKNEKGETLNKESLISVGEKLKAAPGTWHGETIKTEDKWTRCKSQSESGSGATCNVIMNGKEQVTGGEYTVSSEMAGKYIVVQERAWNAGGYTTVSSIAVKVKPNAAPKNLAPPSVKPAGAIPQLTTVSAEEGEWEMAESKPTFQWWRCTTAESCTKIEKATSRTYKVKGQDGGDMLEVEETVSNAIGSAHVRSGPSGVVAKPTTEEGTEKPKSTAAPSIEGELKEGQTLKVKGGVWTGAPSIFKYDWYRCKEKKCALISRPSSPTYTLVHADVGYDMKVDETAENAWGATKVGTPESAAVAAGVPVDSTAPSISGSAQVGLALTGYAGTWTAEPTSYEYTWKRCNTSGAECSTIETVSSPEVESAYVPVEADEGHTIRLEVVARNATGAGAAAVSAATEAVTPPPPVLIAAPVISGSAHPGQVLQAQAGRWEPESAQRSYQWLRCQSGSCSAIAGAEGSSYEVRSGDVGYTLEVRETATDAGGWTAATSEPTATVS